ncbi:MAG: ATP-binding cassette domain-containing protein [Caldisericia bacterium]|nr:ATP-binding cassette domain-containing protein [Caldisericia bacterium]
MEKMIHTTNLTKKFKEYTAVNSLNISIEHGQIFGLLGPNGAGKTTTIKMLITLLAPTSGTADVGGFDIIKHPVQVRKHIGYVPQMISTEPNLTGLENMNIFAKLYDVDPKTRKERIEEAMTKMGIMDSGKKLVGQYSGGMIRKLEIAQSLLNKPSILFLDEPSVGLDPVARMHIWDHIQSLKDEYGATILLTTHYMEEADKLCDEIAIMDCGNISITGSPDELKKSIDKQRASLDDVFVHYTGSNLNESSGFKDIKRTRRTAKRLG